jgi:hypothetical protein
MSEPIVSDNIYKQIKTITSPKNKNYDELLFKNRAYEPLDATVGSDNNDCYWLWLCGLLLAVGGLIFFVLNG